MIKFSLLSAVVVTSLSATSAFAEDAQRVQNCHGTEPFWGLTLTSSKIVLANDIGQAQTQTIVRPKVPGSAQGTSSEYVALYQGKILEKKGSYLNIIIKNEQCSDGMSDEIYPFSVSILSGTTLLIGCCPAGK